MRSSSGAASPAIGASFKRLYQQAFDQEHKNDEGDRIAQYPDHVEQRERRTENKAYPVWPSNQLDHQHNLPDDGKARARACGKIRRKLRYDDVTQPGEPGELK